MKLATETSAAERAWNIFDASAMRLHAMYTGDIVATRDERLAQSLDQARAWYGFLSAYLADHPEVAA